MLFRVKIEHESACINNMREDAQLFVASLLVSLTLKSSGI